MTNPSSPNYKKNVGRLVTDRFDFEDHVTGNNFRHVADQVDLNPIITIDGIPRRNVQQAIQAISDITSVPTVPDADATTKGILKLTGDLGGTANLVTVTGLQQMPVSTTVPATNEVLTWDGYSWTPSVSPSMFSPGNDLSGSNIIQSVVQITGNAGVIPIKAAEVLFDMNIVPTIKQAIEPVSGAMGTHDLTIEAQSTNFATGVGGSVILKGGIGPDGNGGAVININGDILFEAIPVPTLGNRVVSLVRGTSVAPGDVPDGDLVVYIGNAATVPTSSPSAGAILYANDGKLNVKQADGVDFIIGSMPNPSIWGPSGNQVTSYRSTIQTDTSNTPLDILTITLDPYTATRVDVIMVGRELGTLSGETAQVNMSASFYWDGAAQVMVGTVTKTDPKYSAGTYTLPWTEADITLAGNTVYIKTGSSDTFVNWMAITQVIVVQG